MAYCILISILKDEFFEYTNIHAVAFTTDSLIEVNFIWAALRSGDFAGIRRSRRQFKGIPQETQVACQKYLLLLSFKVDCAQLNWFFNEYIREFHHISHAAQVSRLEGRMCSSFFLGFLCLIFTLSKFQVTGAWQIRLPQCVKRLLVSSMSRWDIDKLEMVQVEKYGEENEPRHSVRKYFCHHIQRWALLRYYRLDGPNVSLASGPAIPSHLNTAKHL